MPDKIITPSKIFTMIDSQQVNKEMGMEKVEKMEQLKLLPCSCEAGEKKLKVVSHSGGYYNYVHCLSCGKETSYCGSRELAKETWNNNRKLDEDAV